MVYLIKLACYEKFCLYNIEKAIRDGAAASDANVNADKVRLINILKKI